MDSYLEEDLQKTAQGLPRELYGSAILVTGATGLVGSQVIKTLLAANEIMDAQITVLAQVRSWNKLERLYEDYRDDNGNYNPALVFIGGDLTEELDVPQDVDYIVHTASPTASKYFVEHPVETIDAAIGGTKRILELAKEKNCKGVVYLSSMEAFGVTDPSLPFVTEDDLGYIDIHKVRSCYSESKRLCELLCSCYAAEYGVPVRTARLAQTFGAGIPYEENRVFAQFAKSAMNGTDIVLHTRGLSDGNYVYTADAVAAILLLLVKGEVGEAYTVANEQSHITIGGMAEMVAKELANGQIQVVYDIPEDALTYGYAPDVKMQLNSQKLQALGWKPEVGLLEAYRRMMASMQESRNS